LKNSAFLSNIDNLDLSKVKNVCIITHRFGDIDAFSSSYALEEVIVRNNPNASVKHVFPDGLNSVAEKLREYVNLESSEIEDFKDFDLIAVVDVGSPKLLNGYFDIVDNAVCPKLLVDHHPLQEESKLFYNYFFVSHDVTSSSELVLYLLEKYNVTPTELISNLLLLGILADTRHLSAANENTVKNACSLIDLGASLRWSDNILFQKKEPSEVIAKLKALSRINLYESDDTIISTVKVGSFHASVAKFLIDAGCDIALAYGEEDNVLRGSLRCSNQTGLKETFSLSTLSESLARIFDGVGGGHRLAASFNVKCKDEQLISEFLKLLENMLSTKVEKLSLK